MQGLFKKAIKVTNNSIILAIPFIIFVTILDMYSMYSRYTVDTIPKLVLASVTLLLMFGVLGAGWFYMVKKAITLSKETFVIESDRVNATMGLLKTIPEGIGKYFLSFVGVYIIFFCLQLAVTPLVYYIGVHLIGKLDAVSVASLQELTRDSSLASNAGVANFIEKLTPEQIVFFGKWSLLFFAATSIIMYLLMLWFPEIIYKSANPLVALFKGIGKVFKTFFESLLVFLRLWAIGLLLLFLNTFAIYNSIAYFIMNIIMFYFFIYLVIVIFLYYDYKFNGLENNEQ